jgi:hypothetical protein
VFGLRSIESQAQVAGHAQEAPVASPQRGADCQSHSGEQMYIDVSNTPPEQLVAIYEMQDLSICGNNRRREILQGSQYDFSLAQISQSKFTYDERMDKHLSAVEEFDQRFVNCPEMIDPN